MNTIELQNSLIKKILDIQDLEILTYFNSILSAESKTPYKLNDFEIQLINESLSDYKNKNVISNKDVFVKTEKWLDE